MFRQLHRPPILIGGCARSGTTLLLAILSSNPRIFALPRETRAFCTTAYKRHGRIDEESSISVFRLYRQLLSCKIPHSARRWCEKTPKNVLYFGSILEHFHDRVRLIHMVRDGRDVVTSRFPRNPSVYWVPPRRWVEEVRAGLAWEGHESVITIRYEDLVCDLESQLARLGGFLEEDFSGLASIWDKQATVRVSGAWFHEVRPTHAQSIGRWKDERHRAVVEELMSLPGAVDLLRSLGYETGAESRLEPVIDRRP